MNERTQRKKFQMNTNVEQLVVHVQALNWKNVQYFEILPLKDRKNGDLVQMFPKEHEHEHIQINDEQFVFGKPALN